MTTDIVISFDTTGSMSSVIQQVRRQVQQVVDDLFRRVPDLRVGIVAHGDYADQGTSYLARNTELTADVSKLVDFIRKVPNTCGFSYEEAYEHVLWLARAMNWRADAAKYLIMIGDAEPWGPKPRMARENGHDVNPRGLDWSNEAKLLATNMGVKIVSFHALAYYNDRARAFWRGIAELSGGAYATLDDFPDVVNMIHAVSCAGNIDLLTQYANSLVDANQMTGGVSRTIHELTGGALDPRVTRVTTSAYRPGSRPMRTTARAGAVDLSASGDLEPVAPGRFQVLDVTGDIAIKEMVQEYVGEDAFKKGNGFYQFGPKSVTVQAYKEVVLYDRETGMMWSGHAARAMLGLPDSATAVLSPNERRELLARYDVFIQSTSVNRKLLAGTKFLYQVSFE